MTMRRPAARNLIVFCLLIVVSLLAASCSSSSDSSSAEDTTTISNALISITAGGEHSCTLREGGIISCWGNNYSGQLGNGRSGENADSSVPVQVEGIENTTAITAGNLHSCALSEDGTISCWGDNTYGQLGNGQSGDDWDDRSADSAVPVEVAGITDATAITAGGNRDHSHSCALHQDGTISCWGDNSYGQLGNGQSGYAGESSDPIVEDGDISCLPCEIESSLPVKVEGITNATAITAGSNHSCALHEDGTISCWGDNYGGQLGNEQSGENAYSSVPVSVADITDATAITAGFEHSCALHQDGTISCWGYNGSNQLGSKQIVESSVPVGVIGITDATAITTGFRHSCALRESGAISCWGNNYYGQLGNGQSGPNTYSLDSAAPVEVASITDAKAITAGGNWNNGHSCALHQDGTISCWGDNTYGQLGNGSEDNFSEPAKVIDITDATAVTTGSNHSCALHEDGTISCWGNNYSGQLGNRQSGPNTDSTMPVEVEGITEATAITADYSHSCALHQDGTISCWGSDGSGQLGNGSEFDSAVDFAIPVSVVDITDATAISAGYLHSCALHQDGTISCWGDNSSGQLDNGRGTYSSAPVGVVYITDAIAIAAGTDYSCALHQTGTISCWGSNWNGQLGNGTDTNSSVPVQVQGITDATAITAGAHHSCALHQDGTISCWGGNTYGQLGNGQSGDDGYDFSSVPLEVVGIDDATAITAGSSHSCALHGGGIISCWGHNEYGQLGNGQRGYDFDSALPARVADITDATAITAGSNHSCALHQDGTISCWGDNQYGQLGNGPRLPQFVVGFGG